MDMRLHFSLRFIKHREISHYGERGSLESGWGFPCRDEKDRWQGAVRREKAFIIKELECIPQSGIEAQPLCTGSTYMLPKDSIISIS